MQAFTVFITAVPIFLRVNFCNGTRSPARLMHKIASRFDRRVRDRLRVLRARKR